MARAPLRRCAIYTRKSSEEGLDQDFNSLDAQREACAAYIKSQAGEGWKPVKTRYDDGGLSGGTLVRPALQALLDDIRNRRIDTVVVYKVDRLTRSLSDFARIVDAFDDHDVSFVSITQQFNTTTSMGRLTLNMLLSFAQFEREVTGERIRDKIAASKKKGMWMGGHIPLGYQPDGRTLVINEIEAETVRTVFRLYLELGTVSKVKHEADCMGLVTKLRIGKDGARSGAKPLSRGYIYKLLGNPLYIGRIQHKGDNHAGLHPAIIDAKTWAAVQAQLANNGPIRGSDQRRAAPSLLTGKVFQEDGTPLTPTHAVKSGRRYRYYVSRHLITGEKDRRGGSDNAGWRLPAGEMERIVEVALKGLMADPSALASAVRGAGLEADDVQQLLTSAMRYTGKGFELIDRVVLMDGEMLLTLDLSAFTGAKIHKIERSVPLQMRKRGVEMRLVIPNGRSSDAAKPDAALIKAIARAHRWMDALASGKHLSSATIAKTEGISTRYVGQLLPLAFLAPDIVEAILTGTQPVDLTAEKLVKRVDLPLDWAEQRRVLEFRAAS